MRPQQQPVAAVDDPRRWWGLAVLSVALCAIVLDNTILNVALPTLRRSLGASESDLQWITTAYALTLSGLLLPLAVLGDRFGRRRMLLAGLVLFASASAVAAFTASPLQLAAARAAMGVGGAATTPSTLSLLGNIFSQSERPRAIAIWSGVAGVAAAVGPVVGGLLLSRFWWGSIFLVNVPVVTLTLVAAVLLLPASRAPVPRAVDGWGSLLWVGALGLLLFAVIEGPVRGWGSPPVWGSGITACVLLAGFARQERRAPAPMLGPSTATDPRLRAGATTIVGMFFALFGTQFILTQWIQGPRARSALAAGLCFMPMALAAVGTATRNPGLARHFGHRRVAAAGMAVMAAGLALAAGAVAAGAGLGEVVAALVVMGAGQGAAVPSGVELMMASVPPAQAGSAAGVNETLVEAGGAVGVAVLGSTLAAGGGYATPIVVAAAGALLAGLRVFVILGPRHRGRGPGGSR